MTGGRILIVDDDPILRKSVGRLLEEEGYAVDHAADGVDALTQISERPPDAILLDVLMPRMNGKQFLAALRQSHHTSGIPVVIMTAVSGMIPQHAAVDPDEMVEKPFDIEDLLNKIALAVCRGRDLGGEQKPEAEPRSARPPGPAPARADRALVLLFDPDPGLPRAIERPLAERRYTPLALPRTTDDLPRLARVLEPWAIAVSARMIEGRKFDLLTRLRHEPALRRVPVLVYAERREELEGFEEALAELGVEALVRGEVLDRLLALA